MAKIDNNGELYITRAGSLTKINDLIDNVTLTPTSNISVNDVSVGNDLSVNGVINAVNNCHIMTMNNGNAASGTTYIPDWTVTIKTNPSLYSWTTPTSATASGLKVLRDGYYKFNINENYQNVSYGNRVTVWSKLVINNTPDYRTSGYCYVRHSGYAHLGTIYHNATRYLTANTYVKITTTIAKGNTNFGADWNSGGAFKRQGYDNFEVTYLGN